MTYKKCFLKTSAAALFASTLLTAPSVAFAQDSDQAADDDGQLSDDAANMANEAANTTGDVVDNAAEAVPDVQVEERNAEDLRQQIAEAADVIGQMRQDEQLTELMKKAKGIFVVPDFARGAVVVGARGGTGMLLTHRDGEWSDPAFYNMGGISVGAQAGASAGAIAFLLMSDDAVAEFNDRNSFSLNADAGISIINYSADAQASWGKGDIILWSDTEGAFAGVEISVSDIFWDGEANATYYGERVQPDDILTGENDMSPNSELEEALPG